MTCENGPKCACTRQGYKRVNLDEDIAVTDGELELADKVLEAYYALLQGEIEEAGITRGPTEQEAKAFRNLLQAYYGMIPPEIQIIP